MARSQLWQYLKDNGITQEQAARALGYTTNYTSGVLVGRHRLTRAVKMAFLEVYPETAVFLLPGRTEAT